MVVGLETSDEQRVPQGTAAAAPARPGYSSSTPVARGYSLYWMMNAPAICATMSSAMRNQVSGSANGSKRPRERIFQARLRNATLIVAPVSTAVFADDKPNPTSCREAKRTSTLRAECRVPHRVCCCKLRVVCSVSFVADDCWSRPFHQTNLAAEPDRSRSKRARCAKSGRTTI